MKKKYKWHIANSSTFEHTMAQTRHQIHEQRSLLRLHWRNWCHHWQEWLYDHVRSARICELRILPQSSLNEILKKEFYYFRLDWQLYKTKRNARFDFVICQPASLGLCQFSSMHSLQTMGNWTCSLVCTTWWQFSSRFLHDWISQVNHLILFNLFS